MIGNLHSIDVLAFTARDRTVNPLASLVAALAVGFILSQLLASSKRASLKDPKSLGTEILVRYGMIGNPVAMPLMVLAFTSKVSSLGGVLGADQLQGNSHMTPYTKKCQQTEGRRKHASRRTSFSSSWLRRLRNILFPNPQP